MFDQFLEKYYACFYRLHHNSKVELKETYEWVYANGSGVYPELEIEKAFLELDLECKKLMKEKLLKLLAMSLKLDDVDFFLKQCQHLDDSTMKKGLYSMRALHYPPLQLEDAEIEGAVRLGEHSDYGFLTLLFQDDTGGLEV